MSSPLRKRLGIGSGEDPPFLAVTDRSVMARALMYLLAGIGTAVVASVAIPNAPLHDDNGVVVLAGIAYAAAIGVFAGFERLPSWCIHILLVGAAALISWSVYASGWAGSPYTIFYVWGAMYAAFFFKPWGAAIQVAGMLIGYGVALILLGDQANQPALHWVMTASALVLLAVAIQALTARVARLVDRLTEVGRADSLTGLYNAAAYTAMLDNEVERARRSGNRLGVVVAELDGFMPVTAGPLAARQRQLLASVGSLLTQTPRQIDMCARLGGGRFAILLPYTDEHGAFLLAERIRERLIPLGAPMSLGVACFPRSGASAHAVFQAAETALGEAREAGGNRVIIAQRSSSSARVEIDLPAITEQPLT